MARNNFEHDPNQETRAGSRLAAVVLRDGSMECVDSFTPLSAVLEGEGAEPGSAERVVTFTEEQYNEALKAARMAGVVAFLRYVWFGSKNLWEAMKRLLAITRKTRPDFIRGMSATQVAWMLDETKAATSAREIRVVEEYLIAWGVIGFLGAGGSKSLEARAKYSTAQKGNTNRSGKPREGPKTPPSEEESFEWEKTDQPKKSSLLKKEWEDLAAAAEKRRLAGLCGVDPSEIDLEKTNPKEGVHTNQGRKHHER